MRIPKTVPENEKILWIQEPISDPDESESKAKKQWQ